MPCGCRVLHFRSAPDWRLLLTKESRRLVSRRYAPSTRELSNSSLVSGSDFKRSKFLDRMFFTWWLMGLYVKIKGMTSLLDCPSFRWSQGCISGDSVNVLKGSISQLLVDNHVARRMMPFLCFWSCSRSHHCVFVWGAETGCRGPSSCIGRDVTKCMWDMSVTCVIPWSAATFNPAQTLLRMNQMELFPSVVHDARPVPIPTQPPRSTPPVDLWPYGRGSHARQVTSCIS